MKNRALYDTYAEGRHWDLHPLAYAERFAFFVRERRLDGPLVDIGCGSGRDLEYFHKYGLSCIGLDISFVELAHISRRLSSSFPGVPLLTARAEQLPFRNDSIEAYFMINVIHYTEEEKVIAEMHRTLVSGGYCFLHFNLSIVDAAGTIDYSRVEQDIFRSVSPFKVVSDRKVQRVDTEPKKHTHNILELILQKC